MRGGAPCPQAVAMGHDASRRVLEAAQVQREAARVVALRMEADRLSARGEFEQSLPAYTEVLEVLSAAHKAGGPMFHALTLHGRASSYGMLDRWSEAEADWDAAAARLHEAQGGGGPAQHSSDLPAPGGGGGGGGGGSSVRPEEADTMALCVHYRGLARQQQKQWDAAERDLTRAQALGCPKSVSWFVLCVCSQSSQCAPPALFVVVVVVVIARVVPLCDSLCLFASWRRDWWRHAVAGPHCNIIEAPWLVNGGHGASLTRRACMRGGHRRRRPWLSCARHVARRTG
jgi:hypothetical protein